MIHSFKNTYSFCTNPFVTFHALISPLKLILPLQPGPVFHNLQWGIRCCPQNPLTHCSLQHRKWMLPLGRLTNRYGDWTNRAGKPHLPLAVSKPSPPLSAHKSHHNTVSCPTYCQLCKMGQCHPHVLDDSAAASASSWWCCPDIYGEKRWLAEFPSTHPLLASWWYDKVIERRVNYALQPMIVLLMCSWCVTKDTKL